MVVNKKLKILCVISMILAFCFCGCEEKNVEVETETSSEGHIMNSIPPTRPYAKGTVEKVCDEDLFIVKVMDNKHGKLELGEEIYFECEFFGIMYDVTKDEDVDKVTDEMIKEAK